MNNVDKHPDIKQFVIDQKITFNNTSYLSKAICGDFRILEFINFFLKHSRRVKNGDEVTNKIIKYGGKPLNDYTSQDLIDWHSLLAELEAFYLLQKIFNLNICAYEPQQSNARKPEFEVICRNKSIYFEVKYKGSQDSQRIPKKINDMLDSIEAEYENKYTINIVEIEDAKDRLRYPNCQKLLNKYLLAPEQLKTIEQKLQERLNIIKYYKILEQQDRDSSRCNVLLTMEREINIGFSITLKQENRCWCFRNDEIDDIKSWLFGEEDKKSKVAEAIEKGADYLMCEFPFWRERDETFSDYVRNLFDDFELQDHHFAVSRDNNLGLLSGLILFAKCGSLKKNYIVITNEDNRQKWMDIMSNRGWSLAS